MVALAGGVERTQPHCTKCLLPVCQSLLPQDPLVFVEKRKRQKSFSCPGMKWCEKQAVSCVSSVVWPRLHATCRPPPPPCPDLQPPLPRATWCGTHPPCPPARPFVTGWLGSARAGVPTAGIGGVCRHQGRIVLKEGTPFQWARSPLWPDFPPKRKGSLFENNIHLTPDHRHTAHLVLILSPLMFFGGQTQ
jgi:hypothetical protein